MISLQFGSTWMPQLLSVVRLTDGTSLIYQVDERKKERYASVVRIEDESGEELAYCDDDIGVGRSDKVLVRNLNDVFMEDSRK